MQRTVEFKLSKSQMTKIAKAFKDKREVGLRLSRGMMSAGGVPLELTQTEHDLLMSDAKGHNITIAASRLSSGGFLPAIIAALPTIASVIGGISGLTGIASNIKSMVEGNKGSGFISDLGLPIISPLAKMVGLGPKRRGGRCGCPPRTGGPLRMADGLYMNPRGRGTRKRRGRGRGRRRK